MTAGIHLRRAYDAPGAEDGLRVLVDRLWPRGLVRASAKIDMWLRDIAPSDALRRWFGHEPARWDAFAMRYRSELMANPTPMAELLRLCRAGPVTLLFAAHDTERNNAVVLRDVLRERIKAE
ncbi:MAG: DUF488 family protein [Alphaproteobacteria bacterium]|nr:DUF488 family protein [Alphaproteobacteria bacterium]